MKVARSRLIILATSTWEQDHATAEIYTTTSRTVAKRFCKKWNQLERTCAMGYGGYPGEAYVIDIDKLPQAGQWLAEMADAE